MLQNYCILFCLVAVHGRRSVPPVPVSPVGPFDVANEDIIFTSPSGKSRLKNPGMFEGDIKNSGRGVVGNAGSLNPWPNAVIPYRFDCSVENIPSAIEATKAAMRVWEAKTCIRFVKKRPEDKAFLELFRSAGCWATYVGYRKDTKTQISIGSGCDYQHVMEHELGHVIGFWHEQSRKDRDNYIRINFGNVIPALRYNFNKVSSKTSNYRKAYDYGSIMHYPWNAFAINPNQRTINPTRNLNFKVPYVRLSDVDAAQTNNMYKCGNVQSLRGVEAGQIKNMMAFVSRSRSVGFKCVNTHVNCDVWAVHGHCTFAADPLLTHCPKSCDNCGPCADNNADCAVWKEKGFCTQKPDIMLRHCKVTCGVCIPVPCKNGNRNCRKWSKRGYCKLSKYKNYMLKNCKKACGVCKSKTKPTIAPTTQAPCKDKYNACGAYARYNYCKSRIASTRRYMEKNCMKACKLCGKTPVTTKAPTKAALTAVTLPRKKFTGIKCEDRSRNCKAWRKGGRCNTDRWVKDNCLLSCKRFKICDPTPIKPIGSCTSPLGVGWDNKIPNANFYGTSRFSPGSGWVAQAFGARLYLQDNHARKEVGAWCANPRSRNQYLQIDLGRTRTITAVATQGRDRYFEHVKSYSLSFSRDRRTWKQYEENAGQKKIFDGNCDHFTPVMNLVKKKPVARFIRFHPIRYIGAMCLRVEVYGC